MRALVGTVIYQEAMQYFEDFFNTIENQTDTKFDVLCINDNLNSMEVEKVLENWQRHDQKLYIYDKGTNKNHYELRVQLIKEAQFLKYDLIILCDCDDKFAINRVETIKQNFNEKYAFYYNEIVDFNQKKVMPEMPKVVNNIYEISECNFLGLSNTAINLNKMTVDFIESLKEGNTNIFDWYLFTRILGDIGPGIKVFGTKTLYRIHESNLAGRIEISKQALQREVNIKIEHYQLLKLRYKLYEELLAEYINFDGIERWNHTNEISNQYFWWGMIRLKEKE